MKIYKVGVLVIMGFTPLIGAFPFASSMPYLVAGATVAYSGYKLNEQKVGGIEDIGLHEGLPYAAVALTTLYGLYTLYTSEDAKAQLSLIRILGTFKEVEQRYGITSGEGRVTAPSDHPLVLYEVLSNRLKPDLWVDSLRDSFENDIAALCKCKSVVETGAYSSEKVQTIVNALEQDLIYNADTIMSYIRKLSLALKEHRSFFILKRTLEGASQYDEEEKIMMKNSSETTDFIEQLERYINEKYSSAAYQFPFLSYVQHLQEEKSVLETALRNLEQYKPFPFQNNTIKKARERVALLQPLLSYVVNTYRYKQQKAEKPIFDRNQEIHRQELKERQRNLDKVKDLENQVNQLTSLLYHRPTGSCNPHFPIRVQLAGSSYKR